MKFQPETGISLLDELLHSVIVDHLSDIEVFDRAQPSTHAKIKSMVTRCHRDIRTQASRRDELIVLRPLTREVCKSLPLHFSSLAVHLIILQSDVSVVQQFLLNLQLVPQNLTLVKFHIFEANAVGVGVLLLLSCFFQSYLVVENVPQVILSILVLLLSEEEALVLNLSRYFDPQFLPNGRFESIRVQMLIYF